MVVNLRAQLGQIPLVNLTKNIQKKIGMAIAAISSGPLRMLSTKTSVLAKQKKHLTHPIENTTKDIKSDKMI